MENTWQRWRGVWSGQSGNEDDLLWKRLGGIKKHFVRISPGQDFSLVTLVTVCRLKIDVTSFPNAGDGQFQRHWPLISGIVLTMTMTMTMTMIGFRDSSDEQRCSLFVLKKGYTKIAPPVQVV